MGFVGGFFPPTEENKTKQKNQEGMGELKQIKLDETRRTLTALASYVKKCISLDCPYCYFPDPMSKGIADG